MLAKIEKAVACICVSVMAVLVFANVVARFVFKHSLAVSDEMSTYLFVLMSFMGTAIAARRKAHLGLSIVTDRVSPKAHHPDDRLCDFRSVLPADRGHRRADGYQPVSAGSGNCQHAVA